MKYLAWILLCLVAARPCLAERSTPIRLVPPAGGSFGFATGANASISGDTMIVGGPSGLAPAARIYRWSGTGWNLETTLTPPGILGSNFGASAAISGDLAVVGAPGEKLGANFSQGAVYVYRRTGSTWALNATLTVPGGAGGDNFGSAVAIDGDKVVASARGKAGTPTLAPSAVYIFERAEAWTLASEIRLPFIQGYETFGAAVAISGDTVVIGASTGLTPEQVSQGAAYVYVRNGANWTQQAKVFATDGAAFDFFGYAVAISGESILVGAPKDDIEAKGHQGSAYVFTRTGVAWTQQAKLVASDGIGLSQFGYSVALSESTALVGTNDQEGGGNLGAAYAFVRSGTIWTQQNKILAPDGEPADKFGSTVALSGDTAVIVSPLDIGNGIPGNGSTWVFSRVGSKWIDSSFPLIASDGALLDQYGTSVAISGDTAIVGAPGSDIGGNDGQGSAYILVRVNGAWVEQAKLFADDGASADSFGVSVAIDGDTAVVGANLSDPGGLSNKGAAYVFTRTGPTWTQRTKLVASDGAMFDRFGSSVAMSGGTVLVGSPRHDIGAATDRGAVYVFVPSGPAFWVQQAKLVASDGLANDDFGISVAISGETALVGAYFKKVGANTQQGSAYVYVRTGSTWTQQAILSEPNEVASARQGTAVALSGNTAILTATGAGAGAHGFQGAAYVYVRSGSTWSQQARLTSFDGVTNDGFGVSAALAGDVAVIGESSDVINGQAFQGSAHIFTRSGTTWSRQGKVTAPSGAAQDLFGGSIGISGSTAIAGIPHRTVGANAIQGSAYIFDAMDDFCWSRNANLSVGYSVGYPTLAAAFPDALSGHSLGASPNAFSAFTTLSTLGRTLRLSSLGRLSWAYGSSLTLDTASTLTAGAGAIADIYGTLTILPSSTITVTAGNLLLREESTFLAGTGAILTLVDTSFDGEIDGAGRFNMADATLQMKGTTAERTLEVMAGDIGPNPDALVSAGHFPIGTLWVGPAPSVVRLVNKFNRGDVAQQAAIYVKDLRIDAGCHLINASYKIYYKTIVNHGTVDVPANLIKFVLPCPGDLNGDAQVDDSDFVIFLSAYNILDCNDPAMPTACPSDLNPDEFVDDADFVIFLAAYNTLICP